MAPSRGLRVGGLTPLTTVDYPGELAAVIFAEGCPWRCAYCHNGHLLAGESKRIEWSEVMAFLASRRRLLDAAVFSGGEPTAQGVLPDAIAEVRALGFKIGLHTGGAYPERLRTILTLVDWVGLDIKALPEDYPAVTGVTGSGERAWESLTLLARSGVPFEVRTTAMPGLDGDAYLRSVMDKVRDAGARHYALQHCRDHNAATPRLAGRVLPHHWPGHGFDTLEVRGL